MCEFPSMFTRLPLYFFWVAGNGLLIYSRHLFFVHFKVISILKPRSSFYSKIQSDHKCYPHHLLEKFHFFSRFLRKSQSFEHSQQDLTWSGPHCVSSLTYESTLAYSHFFKPCKIFPMAASTPLLGHSQPPPLLTWINKYSLLTSIWVFLSQPPFHWILLCSLEPPIVLVRNTRHFCNITLTCDILRFCCYFPYQTILLSAEPLHVQYQI